MEKRSFESYLKELEKNPTAEVVDLFIEDYGEKAVAELWVLGILGEGVESEHGL